MPPVVNKPFACFVTGTDTDVGKTLISSALLHTLGQRGIRAAGMKPVAAGSTLHNGVWRNADADSLAAASSVTLPPPLATPYLLREPVAPHIAAALQHISIDPPHILACYAYITELADAVVVEGVGGFRVPLTDTYDTADLAQQLGLPVIMVVGLRLGCISAALVTAEAIAARGLTLAGWVANVVDDSMPFAMDNVAAISARLAAPLLGSVPRLAAADPAVAADHIDFSVLPGWPGVVEPA